MLAVPCQKIFLVCFLLDWSKYRLKSESISDQFICIINGLKYKYHEKNAKSSLIETLALKAIVAVCTCEYYTFKQNCNKILQNLHLNIDLSSREYN